ncbi:hypothetical protein [Limnofasciculus baicalensis]|uniref:Uncharacterized protein n=1 Tax=Limnofasciculus baicalensis BBK-W-15 TaxID=2699891 RepID=A0AAE3KNS4_9CYAN|nr:hypothetical protein [Limnofasciculus baicalensis]MCP2730126.1 hypothetical protein [Limnofasciculus baicalensis BBK-W-15]
MTVTRTVATAKLNPQTMYAEMQRRLPILQHSPEEWLQKMMHWHFDDSTGSPYWLRKKPSLDFDPIRDIRTLDDVGFGITIRQEI